MKGVYMSKNTGMGRKRIGSNANKIIDKCGEAPVQNNAEDRKKFLKENIFKQSPNLQVNSAFDYFIELLFTSF